MKSFKKVWSRRQKEAAVESQPLAKESESKEVVTTTPQTTESTPEQSTKQNPATCKIFVVFYSMYGHVYKMAQAVKKGIDSVDGCEAVLYQAKQSVAFRELRACLGGGDFAGGGFD